MRGPHKLLSIARIRRDELEGTIGQRFEIPPLEVRCSVCGRVLGITVRRPSPGWDPARTAYGGDHAHRHEVPSDWMRSQIDAAVDSGHKSITLPKRFLVDADRNGRAPAAHQAAESTAEAQVKVP